MRNIIPITPNEFRKMAHRHTELITCHAIAQRKAQSLELFSIAMPAVVLYL